MKIQESGRFTLTKRNIPSEARHERAFSFPIQELMDRSSARLRYAQHKAHAKHRGIEWEFTFEEWCEIWAPHWTERGVHSDQLGMCRTHDKGPYRADNVRLDSPKGNAAERGMMQKCARPRWFASQDQGGYLSNVGFKSHGNFFPRPDKALEIQQEEYEWIPGE